MPNSVLVSRHILIWRKLWEDGRGRGLSDRRKAPGWALFAPGLLLWGGLNKDHGCGSTRTWARGGFRSLGHHSFQNQTFNVKNMSCANLGADSSSPTSWHQAAVMLQLSKELLTQNREWRWPGILSVSSIHMEEQSWQVPSSPTLASTSCVTKTFSPAPGVMMQLRFLIGTILLGVARVSSPLVPLCRVIICRKWWDGPWTEMRMIWQLWRTLPRCDRSCWIVATAALKNIFSVSASCFLAWPVRLCNQGPLLPGELIVFCLLLKRASAFVTVAPRRQYDEHRTTLRNATGKSFPCVYTLYHLLFCNCSCMHLAAEWFQCRLLHCYASG